MINDVRYFSPSSVEDLKTYVRSFGIFGPLLIIFLVVLRTAIPFLPIPTPLFLVTNGLVYGFWLGFLISWAAHLIAALYAFYFSRVFGERTVHRLLRNRGWGHYDLLLGEKGPYIVFFSRLLMVAPFNIVSYLAGLTPMSSRRYIVATAVGVLPEAALFAYLGAYANNFNPSFSFILKASGLIIAGVILIGLMAIARRYVLNRLNQKDERDTTPEQ